MNGQQNLAPNLKGKAPKPKPLAKNIFFYLFLVFLAWALLVVISPASSVDEEKPISEVLSLIRQEKVKKIEIEETLLKVELKDGQKLTARKEVTGNFLETLSQQQIDPAKVSEGIIIKQGIPWADLLFNIAPVLLTAIFFFVIIRQARGGATEIFSFGKSRAKLFGKKNSQITFADVAGADEAKQELIEVVDFLKNADKYRKLGARIPKGVLLVGPAGVGKTMLAKAVAAEAKVPFFSMAGSEFMEMLVGVGASRVRDLFQTAKANAPSLIFIDEIESIGRQRGLGLAGGHDERDQTLNQILVEMDGFDPRDNVIVLAATNRPDLLDSALVRPGRFDRRIVLEFPDIKEREAIIKIHMRGKPFTQDVNVEKLAQRTVGFSGADLENMLNEAAIMAARFGRSAITAQDLEESATKVKLGPERKRLQSDEDKKMTAYHEAGHAVVASKLPHMDPVHRVSIVARGLALGFTMYPPKVDRYNETKTRLLEIITSALGGRAAEEVVFGEVTVGGASDFEQATSLAYKMVTSFGMSELGLMSFDNHDEERVWRLFGQGGISEEMAGKVDTAVKKIIDECYQKATAILQANRPALDRVAEKLVTKETLEQEELKELL
ncbi:MAG: ATP-dependent zinc metalloprotease FtsH [bacterium]|nr:ATP-dependent zinc metalloprotease FtsH [bacterium]